MQVLVSCVRVYYRPKRILLQYLRFAIAHVVTDFRSFFAPVFNYEGCFPQTPSESCFHFVPDKPLNFSCNLSLSLQALFKLSNLSLTIAKVYLRIVLALRLWSLRSLFLIVSPSIPQNMIHQLKPNLSN